MTLARSKSYNRDAVPFFPSESTSSSSSPGDNSHSSPVTSNYYSYFVSITNLPPIEKSELVDLIKSVLETDVAINIVNFQPQVYWENDQEIKVFHSLIELSDGILVTKIIENLNGLEWKLKILDAKMVSPYYPYYYPMVQPSVPAGMALGGFPPLPPSPTSALAHGGIAIPPPPQYYYHHNHNHNHHPSSHHHQHYPHHHYGYQQQMHSLYPHHHHHHHQQHHGGHNHNPYHQNYPPPPMSRRSSSSSSASISSSNNSSTPTSTNNTVPQFLKHLVNKPVAEETSFNPDSQESITIKNDEGQAIKVNPCRLFIGNIPFSSTWPNLKNFLVTKSNELEPDNTIEILRVEIPMHSNNSLNNLNKLNNYQFLSSFVKEDQLSLLSRLSQQSSQNSTSQASSPQTGRSGLSRGFAIVTTGNKQSSDKLIKYFDGIEFEGRMLTVRYDKFPDFNNYILQQLYPNPLHKDSKTLSNLAFERNSFQQKFYYGNNTNPQFPIMQPNFIPPIHPSSHYTNNLHIPRSVKKKPEASVSNDDLNEDEKARELVNSFKSLDISS